MQKLRKNLVRRPSKRNETEDFQAFVVLSGAASDRRGSGCDGRFPHTRSFVLTRLPFYLAPLGGAVWRLITALLLWER